MIGIDDNQVAEITALVKASSLFVDNKEREQWLEEIVSTMNENQLLNAKKVLIAAEQAIFEYQQRKNEILDKKYQILKEKEEKVRGFYFQQEKKKDDNKILNLEQEIEQI